MHKSNRTDIRHARTAGGVVINAKTGKIVVVSQHGDSWSLPKGHVEPGEDDLTAARREIAEETGITSLTYVRPLGEYERHRIGHGGEGEDADELKTLVFFLFTTDQDALRPTDLENPEARWIDRGDVAEMLTHKKDAEFFRSVIGRLDI